jgi:hypothetical protein
MGLWYRRPVTEAGQRALIAFKRMNWFATPPHTPERYRNPRPVADLPPTDDLPPTNWTAGSWKILV